MKLCQNHWNALKEAIENRGLAPLVSKAATAQRMMENMKGDTTKENYNPLMAANFAIWSNGLQAFGLSLLATDNICPLCLLDLHAKDCHDPNCKNKETSVDWIGHVADAQLEYASKRNWIAKPS